MSDIEILEEFRKSIKNFNNYADNTNVSLINKKQVKAIENLIKENKELNEKIKGLECENEIRKYCKVDEVINDLTYYKNLAKEYQGNSIPKSKVETEIKYLCQKYNIEEDYFKVEQVVDILNELLEGE